MEQPMDIGRDPPDQTNKSPFSLSDPDVVKKILEDLKSHGILDEARKACNAEVESKPAYLNLQRRIHEVLDQYLAGRCQSWNPSVSKSDLRAQIRKYLEDDAAVNSGISRIVDQILSQKMYSCIEPAIETFVFANFNKDITKKDEVYEQSNGGSKKPVSPSKMSTISSEEMDEAGDGDSSPGNQIRGNISPLTPQRKDPDSSLTKEGEVSDDASRLRGDISPLTPVPADKSSSSFSDDSDDDVDSSPPRTPPMPPPPKLKLDEAKINAQLSDEQEDEMSPVSDVELEQVSPPADSPTTPEECNFPSPPMQRTPAPPSDESVTPPPLPPCPPPPPPPMQMSMTPPPPPRSIPPRPASLLTSPIGSSSDEMETTQKSRPKGKKDTASSVSASDISDTDFACQSESEKVSSEEGDLEELERTRAELQARLQAAHLEGSDEGEFQSEEDRGSGTPAGKSDAQIEKELLSISPISDESDTEKDSESEAKSEPRHGRRKSGDGGDDDNGGASGGGSANPGSSGHDNLPEGRSGSDDSKSHDEPSKGYKSDKSSSSNDKEHKKSHEKSHGNKSHHRHHTSSGSSREDKRKQSSSSSNHRNGSDSNGSSGSGKSREKDKHRDPKKEGKKEDPKKEDNSDKKESKESKAEREKKKEKDRMKLEKIESEISKKCGLKSERFVGIDMFAPKARPKMPASSSSTPKLDRSSSQGSPTSSNQGSSKASGTPKGSDHGQSSSSWNATTPPSKGYKTPKSDKVQDLKQSEKTRRLSASDLHREAVLSGQSPIFERRALPELPVPKCGGDKKQQHLSDFNDTKRLLQEATQRRIAEKKALEETKKKEKQLLQAAQKLDGSGSQRVKQKQRNNSNDLVKPQRSVVDTNSDTSDGEWNTKDEKILNRSIARRRQRSGKKRLSTSSEDDENSSENKMEPLRPSRRFHGFFSPRCDRDALNQRLNLCTAINFFTLLHENSSSFGTPRDDSGISGSDADEVSIPLGNDENDEIVVANKRPRLEEPEPEPVPVPALAFETPDEDDSMMLEESVENIMKEVAASKPERVKIYGFPPESIRKEICTLSKGDLYGLGKGYHLQSQRLHIKPEILINKQALEIFMGYCKGDKSLENICGGTKIFTKEHQVGLRELISDEFLIDDDETSSNDADACADAITDADANPPPEKRPRQEVAGPSAQANVPSSDLAQAPSSPPESKSVTAQPSSQVIAKSVTAQQGSQITAKSVTAQQGSPVTGTENHSSQAVPVPVPVTRPIFQPRVHSSPGPSTSTLSSSLVSPGPSPVLAQKRGRPKFLPQTQPAPQALPGAVSQPQIHQGRFQNPQTSATSSSSSNNNDSISPDGGEKKLRETTIATITRSGRRSGVRKRVT